ncbi:MAG TPA: DUF3105 domain-containing protein [Polyangiaceae bacterium]|nr:DUF3105 domain-containing protein [Polyangiaceae bacterium]
MPTPSRILALLTAVLSGCGGGHARPSPAETATADGFCGTDTAALIAAAGDPADPATPALETPIAGSQCGAVERQFAIEDSPLVTDCSPVAFDSNPPSSGPHYFTWPKYKTYEQAIPRGFTVHALSHGAVVFAYSCTDCSDEVASAQQVLDAVGVDPICCTAQGCGADATTRLLMTPDPGLKTRWAAQSWGFTLTADCFEPDVFMNFTAHRGQGPEMLCADGTDVSLPKPD